MRFVSIDDKVYRLTEKQFEKIEKSFDRSTDEGLDDYMAAVEALGRFTHSLDGRYNY